MAQDNFPDPSKMTDAELQAEMASYQKNASNTVPTKNDQPMANAPMAQTSQNVPTSLKDPSKMTDQELRDEMAQHEPNMLQKAANSPIVSGINALGGGLQKGITTGAGMVEGLATDMASRIGLLSPQTKQAIDAKAGKLGAAVIPPNYVKQSMEDHPIISTIGNIAGVGAALAPLGVAAGSLAGGAGASEGLAGATNYLVTGAAAGGDNNRAVGALSGLVGGKIFEKAGEAIKNTVSAVQINSILKGLSDKVAAVLPKGVSAKTAAITNTINEYQLRKAAVDELETQFKSVPGTFEAKDLKTAIDNTLDQHGDLLSGTQKAILTKASDQLNQPQSMTQLVDLKQRLNSNGNYRLFNNDNTPGEVADSYRDIMTGSKQQIAKAMQNANQSDLYAKYADTYKKTLLPLQQMNIGKLAQLDPNSLKFAQLSKTIFNNMTTKGDPEKVTAMMQALGNEGRTAVGAHLINSAIDAASDESGNIVNPMAFVKSLHKLGGTYDAAFTPETKEMLDGAKKIALQANLYNKSLVGKAGKLVNKVTMGIPGHIISALLDHPVGQTVLQKVGTSPNGADLATRILEQAGAAAGGFEGSNIATRLTD